MGAQSLAESKEDISVSEVPQLVQIDASRYAEMD
jgi:hypothetical protein